SSIPASWRASRWSWTANTSCSLASTSQSCTARRQRRLGRRKRSRHRSHEYLRPIHRTPDRDRAADGRPVARRPRRLSTAADRGAAKRELSDLADHGPAARCRSADHGVFGGNAARDAVRANPGPHADDLRERAGLHADHAAVRFEPANRWGRGGCAVRYPRGQFLSDAQPAVPPNDQQSDPSRHADPRARTHVGHAATHDRGCLRRKHFVAKDLANIRSRLGRNRRTAKTGNPHPGRSSGPGGARAEPRRRPQCDRLDNVDLPKGTLNSPRQTYTLNTNDQLFKPDAYADLIIAYRNGSPVRVKDVGKAIGGPENNLIAAWFNKQRAIILPIQRSPGADVIATVDRIKAMMPVLQASTPSGIKIDTVSDRTETIRASVTDVQFTLVLSVALVVLVIFLFLRNVWATIIPAVTV